MILARDLTEFRWLPKVLRTPVVAVCKWVGIGVMVGVAFGVTGCQAPAPSIQLVPKDTPFVPPSATAQWTYTAPPNWVSKPSGPFRLASFDIPVGSERVDCSVSTLSGTAGGMLENTNRWRGQLGLSPLSQLPRMTVISIAGQSYHITRMATDSKGIVVISRLVGDHTWFFKLTGPPRSLPQAETELRRFLLGVSLQ